MSGSLGSLDKKNTKCNLGGNTGKGRRLDHLTQTDLKIVAREENDYQMYMPEICQEIPQKSYGLRSGVKHAVVLSGFYQVILVNRTNMICSDFRRPSELFLGSACCIISHVHTP